MGGCVGKIKDDTLRQDIIKYTQFPYGKRDVQYQTVDSSLPGIRNMEHRYDIINFPKSFKGETILDIGCSIGMICLDAKRRGAKRVVGIDYKQETIEVAKKLASEVELDVEFYTFDINMGLDNLIDIIGDDKFDHVFALSIWAHVDKQKLANMINYYSDKICWFEGHEAGWTGDTKNKIEEELTELLDFKYQEYLGETTDRSHRQNYKLSHSYRVMLNDRGNMVYFNGDVYNVIRTAYEKTNSGDLSYSEDIDKYSYKGKFCNYIADVNSDYGYKIFIEEDNDSIYDIDLMEKLHRAEKIYKFQNLLHTAGFSPKVHEIIVCHDDQTFFYGIKVDNLRGKFIDPPNDWKQNLIRFCESNGLYRIYRDISEEIGVNNCIEVDGKIYLVDIDFKWEQK